MIHDFWFRARTLLGLNKAETELNEEFSFHVEMERRKLIEQGMSGAEAEREAMRRFGGMTRERQRARDQWGIGLMRDLASDVRHAFRQFRRRPAFTGAGVLTLALGIGATVSLFSVVRGTLLRPLPVSKEEQLHVFWSDYDWRGSEFDFVKPRAQAFSGVMAYTINGYTLTLDDGNITTLSGLVSAEFFDVLGTPPALGRTFAAGDDRPGAEPKVVLGHGLWQRTFGGDSSVIGRRLTIDGAQVTVIGVMPRQFYFPTPQVEMWRPLNLDPASGQYSGTGWLVLVGRASPRASSADVARNIETIAASLGQQFTYPAGWDKSKNAKTTLLREYLMGNVRPALMLLLGAVVALLLMACANVAALVLSRTTDRAPEMALRTALGAGSGRLARQIIAESLALSTIAGIIGAVLAVTTFGVLVGSLPLRDGLDTTLRVDWSMFAVGIVIAAAVGLFVAAAPVRHVLRGQLKGIGGERSAAGLRGGQRFHSTMVAVEMGLGVTLAAGALLLVRSVSQLYSQETGFDSSGVVTVEVIAPRDMPPDARAQFLTTLTERARALPGIRSVGFVSRLPVRDGGFQGPVQSASRPDIPRAEAPTSFVRNVTPGYFETMGISIVRGRDFTIADRAGAAPVAIVSESFAKRFWPDKDPIGQLVGGASQANPVWSTVVGVAEETRLFRMVGDNPLGLYVPVSSAPGATLVLVAKTDGDRGAAMASLRPLVREIDRRVAVSRVISMDDVVATSLADRLQLRFFLTIFATLALVLGAIGVYGVVSYAVSRRRAEFGVRLALGATSGRVLREVVARGLTPVAIGVAAGVGASVYLSRFVSSFLFGVAPHDVLSLVGAAAALLVAGVVAVIVPGLRAGRTSPMEVLRGE